MAGISEFQSRVQVDPVKLARFLRSPESGILRDLMARAQIVKAGAQRRVGVWKPEPGDPFAARRIARRRPGTLRDSIVTRVVDRGSDLPGVLVGSDDPIAFLHHEGTAAHTIRARRKPKLVFYAGGRVRRVTSVRHPGTDPNPYLTDALRDLPRR